MGFEAVPGLIMLLGAIKCAESPHWLLRRGLSGEAERVLHRIYQPLRRPDGALPQEAPGPPAWRVSERKGHALAHFQVHVTAWSATQTSQMRSTGWLAASKTGFSRCACVRVSKD